MNCGIVRFQPDCLAQQHKRFIRILRHRGCCEGKCAEEQVVCVQIVGPLATRSFDLGSTQSWLYCADDTHRHLILQGEDISKSAVILVSPKMSPGRGLNELRCYPNAFV